MTVQPTPKRFLKASFKKPHKKHLHSSLLVLAVSSCLFIKPIPAAQAGVFDSLLKILLPFYDESHDTSQPDKTQQIDSIDQFIDDGTDEGYLPNSTDENMPTTGMFDLDDVIFNDVLTAHDSTPMLGYPDLYALLSAEFGIDRGQVHTALTIYKAESFKTNATAVFERALALSIEYETPSQSLAFARAWQRQNPEHIPAWFYVAHLALKAGDYHEASDAIGMILDYDSHADLTGILTGIFPQSPDEQRSLFYALQMMDDDNPSLSVLRAGLLLQLGDYAPALAYANKALKSAPQNLSFITLKIDILKASGQEANMWAFIRQKLKEMPHIKELHLYQIRHDIDQGELGHAWELLQVANRQTHDPDVSLLTALVGLDIGKYSEARAILTPLLDNLAFKSRANYYIAISYERTGNMSVAKEYYERVQDYEHVLDARTKVVGFYLAKDDVDKAIATLIRLRDDFEIYTVDSYLWQAEILMRQGKKTEAQNLLTAANREYPDDDRLLFASFLLLENELTDDDKRFAIDKLLELDEFNLAYRLADIKLRLHQSPDDKSALSDAIAISQIKSDDPNYDPKIQLDALVVLGNHALLMGDYKAVLEYLETPYEVAPDLNAGIVLLRAYQGLGEHDKVYALLSDLQNRFAFGANNTGNEAQEY
ncbi:MAG: tetratricopeptide repeat protein [Moraxella sp.]|uniref:tetratricopeptide repeat protein n=1 Tax=Moraxella sp. TaxID=479 RepID=UPI0026DD28D7|nr:tetratricopeptide repeat protein [Moraxella sp.]MDO4450493.1 tetratricopeptide repeat protein [Moraxella sp.]